MNCDWRSADPFCNSKSGSGSLPPLLCAIGDALTVLLTQKCVFSSYDQGKRSRATSPVGIICSVSLYSALSPLWKPFRYLRGLFTCINDGRAARISSESVYVPDLERIAENVRVRSVIGHTRSVTILREALALAVDWDGAARPIRFRIRAPQSESVLVSDVVLALRDRSLWW